MMKHWSNYLLDYYDGFNFNDMLTLHRMIYADGVLFLNLKGSRILECRHLLLRPGHQAPRRILTVAQTNTLEACVDALHFVVMRTSALRVRRHL